MSYFSVTPPLHTMTRKTGTDAASAGTLAVAILVVCILIGWGLGALVHAVAILVLLGVLVGFIVGFLVIRDRFRDL
jgi:ABC-type polysaccharide/polyol phosphate export permease